jgi:hypothetical protein
MEISMEDRGALLRERIVVHSVIHWEEFGTHLFVTAPDEKRAREVIAERFGEDIKVEVCGDELREVRPLRCDGHMEREPGRLQLRYALQDEEHMNTIIVTETDEQVIVLGTVCRPVDLPPPGHLMGGPYHVYLDNPLGERTVFDVVADRPVPYFNVYDGIEERVAGMRAAG